jgi:GMP reductase
MASNMDTVGTFNMLSVLQTFDMPTMMNKFISQRQWETTFTHARSHSIDVSHMIPSLGMTDRDKEILKFLKRQELTHNPSPIHTIAFDVANGYMESFVSFMRAMRDTLGDQYTIIAGNVATPEGVEALIMAGVDIVKVGIGSGSQCLTRMKTGVGVPQLTAIIECADAAHGIGGFIISDGGIKSSADISKAFGAGADFVMVGSMFAGHDESGGLIRIIGGVKYKEVYGMSSQYAMQTHYGEQSTYRASEGDYNLIKHRGPITPTVNDILGGVRSTMTYIGAKRIKDIPKCTTFIPVNHIRG